MIRVVYGSGYISSLFREIEGFEIRERKNFEIPSNCSLVLDTAFPRNYKDKEIWEDYVQTIERRIKVAHLGSHEYIYLGSTSSLGEPSSRYGIQKRQIENLVLSKGGSVMRLGLVINMNNPGGRFLELTRILRRLPYIPVPDPAYFALHLTYERDVIAAITTHRANSMREDKDFICQGTHTYSLGELISDYAVFENRRTFRMGLPLSRFLRLVAKTRIGPLDNLSSLL